MDRREKNTVRHSHFQNLYTKYNPALYLISFFPNDPGQVSWKEKRKIWYFSKPPPQVEEKVS
jgi:hypothetical protein